MVLIEREGIEMAKQSIRIRGCKPSPHPTCTRHRRQIQLRAAHHRCPIRAPPPTHDARPLTPPPLLFPYPPSTIRSPQSLCHWQTTIRTRRFQHYGAKARRCDATARGTENARLPLSSPPAPSASSRVPVLSPGGTDLVGVKTGMGFMMSQRSHCLCT